MMRKSILAVVLLALAMTVAACGGSDDGGNAKAVKSDDANATEIQIIATNYKFDQTEYKVKQGEPIKLVLHNEEGLHDIAIPDLGIKLNPDEPQTYVINEPGTYNFHCDTICGSGHNDMKAKLIVE